MSKTTVHVLVPYTIKSACGIVSPYITSGSRDSVTCKNCKKTQEYKDLPRASKKLRKRS